ncbi:HAD family hydrolase [Nocardia noduli]|uniref:HAD family hydrolase n=1 Tax=Nocardia noduli TaxID=2815722 RepID=UPI001C23488E|nr:HAD hydrolase-like protein [Nocardia noduli]
MTDLRQLLSGRPCLLLDFDGPVCSVFAGISSRHAAQELEGAFGSPLPPHLRATSDPFELLEYAADLSPAVAAAVEAKLTEIEVQAVGRATPTIDAHNVIRLAALRPGGSVAIVSNNSTAAINAYLTAHGMHQHVSGIFARRSATTRLKPSPDLLSDALTALDVQPDASTFIGDSVTDLKAAHAAAVPAIGFANKPGKAERFAQYSPASTIVGMSVLLDALRSLTVSG